MSTPLSTNVSTAVRSPLGGVGALVTAGALVLIAGPLGIAAGIGLFVSWAASPGIYAFALGQILFAVLVPEPTGIQLGVVEGGLLVLLIGSTDDRIVSTTVLTTGAFVLLFTIIFATREWWDGLWPAALTLVATVGLLGYVMHRFELVRLGLVEGSR